MKHLALAAFAGLSLYLVLNLFFGPGGLGEKERLEAHKARIEANIDELEALNRALNAEIGRLRSDPDEIAIRARELGYYRPNEEVIRFEGWSRASEPRSPGGEVRIFTSNAKQQSGIRSAAAAAALLTLILSLSVERVGESRRDPRTTEEPNGQSRTHTASRA